MDPSGDHPSHDAREARGNHLTPINTFQPRSVGEAGFDILET